MKEMGGAWRLRVLLYGYCRGVASSRKIEQATYEDVAFRFLPADTHPDHDTIAAFRKRHLDALAGLFLQVLQLCQKAGLVKLGHVAIDGTKIKANASKHQAISYSPDGGDGATVAAGSGGATAEGGGDRRGRGRAVWQASALGKTSALFQRGCMCFQSWLRNHRAPLFWGWYYFTALLY